MVSMGTSAELRRRRRCRRAERLPHEALKIWWDVAWFVLTVANTLTIVFIAKGIEATGRLARRQRHDDDPAHRGCRLAYLGILFEFLMETVAWERWEGTIEYTFMAPLSQKAHLAGQVCSRSPTASYGRPSSS